MSARRSHRRAKKTAATRPPRQPAERGAVEHDPAAAPLFGATGPERRIAIAIALALIALDVLVYTPVWRHEFVSFDDTQYVTENVHVTAGLTWSGLRWALTTGTAGNWHPLTWMSHMVDVQLFGLNPGLHHVTNLLFHIANSLLLFGLLWRMTGMVGRSGVVAALFAVHPMHVESVAWIAERKDVLSTFFSFLALLAYAEYARRKNWASYALVLVFLALGLMSKPMVVTLPCVMLLLDYWPLRRPLTRGLIVEKLPCFALVAASSVVTFIAQSRGGAVSALAALPLSSRVSNALLAYATYMLKLAWPTGLSPLYPYTQAFGWLPVGACLLLAAITVLAAAVGRRHRYVIVGWLWYLGTLVPVIGLVQVGIQSMADRYTYVPAIGLFIVVVWGIADLADAIPWRRAVLATVAGAPILACALAAHLQVQYWKNSLSLWEHANRVTPRAPHVETALGSVLAEQGRIAEATALYTDALLREPQFAEAHNKLGVVFADQGRIAEAIPHYEAALRYKPSLAEAHYNLGNALAAQGKYAEAIAQYRTALRIRPDDPAAHNGLGSALDDQGQLDDAMAEYRQALLLNPNFADAHNNLGAALAKQGRTRDAIGEFVEALKIRPNQADTHYNLAVMLNQEGRTADAVQHLQEALRLQPNHPGARRALQMISGNPR